MLKEYTKRLIICLIGLALYGLGNFFGVKAGAVGTNAWNTLALGISSFGGISFGTASFYISLFVIIIDLLGRGKLGFGTILNATLIAVFSDIFLSLFSFIPEISSTIGGLISTLIGQIILAFGTVVYMKAALGCGPRDTLMVIIGKKIPRVPIGAVRFGLELVVLIVGFLMGAPFGIGTIAVMVLQATIFQFVCNVCRFEPRSIKHEDVIDTCRRVFSESKERSM